MKRNNVKQITVRLTADEYAHVKQLSKDSGLKMEPAIRRLIMGVNLRPRPPDELPELLRQLSGIGTNINQIAKVANASGYVRKEDIQNIMEMQAALWRAVKRGYRNGTGAAYPCAGVGHSLVGGAEKTTLSGKEEHQR